MAGILFDKRYSRGSYYDTESDLVDLFAFLRREGRALGINPERSCVVVYSGGGPLLSVALRRMQPAARCAVAFYAFLDSGDWGPPADERRAKAMEDFSPAVQVRAKGSTTPPLLVIKAALDGAALNATVDNFMKVARESGASVRFMEHGQGRHGFDILDNNDRSREIIRATLEFLRAHLR
jgi:acetyl esterase/lipase